MCANPRLPVAAGLRQQRLVLGVRQEQRRRPCSPTRSTSSSSRRPATNRPFAVIDDGWQPGRGADKAGAGTWDRGNEKFPDMPALAADDPAAPARARASGFGRCRRRRTRPTAGGCRATATCSIPTVPEVREKIADDIARIREWGFELIKHDYTTFDIFGRWGFQMGSALTRDGWTFASGPTRTTAEVIDDLYSTIRDGGRRRARHRLQHRQPSLGRATSRSAASATTRAAPSGRARGRWA